MRPARRAMSMMSIPHHYTLDSHHAALGMHTRFGRKKDANPRVVSSLVAVAKVPVYALTVATAVSSWCSDEKKENNEE